MTSSWTLNNNDRCTIQAASCRSYSKDDKDSQPDEFSIPFCRASENSISCTTFNILAPIYKRIGSDSCRESQFHDAWLRRNQRILDFLLHIRSSIICLQEFWLDNEELVCLYEKALGCAGYSTFKLARTNNRGDGLLTAIRMDHLRVVNYGELLFYSYGDRVAQFFHLHLKSPFHKRSHSSIEQELLLVNTHLLFPHNSSFCHIRLRQVQEIIEFLEHFEEEHDLSSAPVILCGDWNGSKRGDVYKFLRSQGFVSAYDTLHCYTDNDAHRWISHRNHRGNLCGVDFIWFRNAVKQRPLSSPSAMKPISANEHSGLLQRKLQQQGIVPKAASISIMDNMDSPSNAPEKQLTDITGGLVIEDAFLFPPEVEQGLWPEDYSLSDHAPLVAVFEPVK